MPETTETTVLKVKVDGQELAIDSIKTAKKAIKDLSTEILNGNKEAEKSLAKVKDRLEDIQDATASVKGSGIEKATASFQLLGDSFRNLDFDKFKIGLAGLKGALASTGVLLLVQGVVALIENFDSLSKGSGLLAKSLRFLGDIVSGIKDFFLGLTDAIGLTNTALDEQGELIAKNAEKGKEALDAQTAAYDRQIAVAKAAGKSTVELEELKQKAIIDTNLAVAKQIEAFVRAGGELDDEKKKQLTASLEAIKNAKVQEYVITETDNKAKQEQYKKHLEALKKLKEQSDKDVADAVQRVEDARIKNEVDQNNDLAKRAQDRLAAQQKLNDDLLKEEEETSNAFLAVTQKTYDASIAKAQAEKDAKVQLTQQGIQAAMAVSDLFFQSQINGAAKNSKEQKRIAKEQFEVNKAFNLAAAGVSGTKAVLSAYADTPGGPIIKGFAAVVAGAFAIAQIAKISNAKFDGGTSSVDSSGPSAVSAPPPPPQILGNNGPTATQIARPQQATTRVVVLESDITNSQNTVTKVTQQSKF